jgi:hypothetical protein
MRNNLAIFGGVEHMCRSLYDTHAQNEASTATSIATFRLVA